MSMVRTGVALKTNEPVNAVAETWSAPLSVDSGASNIARLKIGSTSTIVAITYPVDVVTTMSIWSYCGPTMILAMFASHVSVDTL